MTPSASPSLEPSPGRALAQLFDDERAFSWRADPPSASADGIHTYDDRLPSVTPAAQALRVHADEQFMRRLRAIERRKLNARQQVSYDLFEFMVSQRVTLAYYREWRMPLNSDSGFHSDVLFLDELTHPQTVADYENFIARLNDVPRFFDENIANMRDGMRDGFTLPAAILDGVSKVIAGEQYDNARKMPLWRPFAQFSPAVPQAQRARLAARGGGRACGCGDTRLCRIPALLRNRIPRGRAGDPWCVRAPRRPRLLRRPGSPFHDASRGDAGRDPRHRRWRGCAHSRGDGGDPPRPESCRGPFQLSRLPAQRSAISREDGGGFAARSGVDREGNRRQAAGLFRQAAAHALRGETGARGVGAELHRRALQPGADGGRRRVLGQYLRARYADRSTRCPR